MAKKSFFKKTNPYPGEEISDSNHPQRISCNKKAKSICRTRRRNLIKRKSLVSSLLQVVHQKFSSHLQIHKFGLLTILIWFTSLKKTTRILYAMRKIQKHVLVKTKLLTIGGH
ncbi:hypothetical protein RGQ29_026657 [Quercus rubra]|uniref:Uncharacterized protein n=1 Tax=Quercus rubra TaxID=3512 RepID=A0AAN7EMA1_QUERU|nr:hypothetical protein RGQ29_026657 [Quercus rubra]